MEMRVEYRSTGRKRCLRRNCTCLKSVSLIEYFGIILTTYGTMDAWRCAINLLLNSLEPVLDVINSDRLFNLVAVICPFSFGQVDLCKFLSVVNSVGNPSVPRGEVCGFEATAIEYHYRLKAASIGRDERLHRIFQDSHRVLPRAKLAFAQKMNNRAPSLGWRRLAQRYVIPFIRYLAAVRTGELQIPSKFGPRWPQFLYVFQRGLYLQRYLHHTVQSFFYFLQIQFFPFVFQNISSPMLIYRNNS